MEVSADHLETRDRFEDVIVRVLQDGLLRRVGVFRAEVVVNSHTLGRASRSVVKRIVLLLAIGRVGALVPDGIRDAPRRISLAMLRLHDS